MQIFWTQYKFENVQYNVIDFNAAISESITSLIHLILEQAIFTIPAESSCDIN